MSQVTSNASRKRAPLLEYWPTWPNGCPLKPLFWESDSSTVCSCLLLCYNLRLSVSGSFSWEPTDRPHRSGTGNIQQESRSSTSSEEQLVTATQAILRQVPVSGDGDPTAKAAIVYSTTTKCCC
ncbi:hypothetical protein GEMRC1_008065 [Eukaryota sp. GEM-RC1]